jgi:tetratricopeptide (TPR) repeat protein
MITKCPQAFLRKLINSNQELVKGKFGFYLCICLEIGIFFSLAASAAYRIEQEINKSGIRAGLKKFCEIKSDPENKLYFEESEFNAMGYRLMGNGKIREAIEVFKLNVELYPDSANVYDSLGEAYMNSGDAKNAISNYKKSLQLNPDNDNAKRC